MALGRTDAGGKSDPGQIARDMLGRGPALILVAGSVEIDWMRRKSNSRSRL